MKRRSQQAEQQRRDREERDRQRVAEIEAAKAAAKKETTARRKSASARDRAMKKRYGTTSVITGATDSTRVNRERNERRIREEGGRPIEVRYVCICPKPKCKAHNQPVTEEEFMDRFLLGRSNWTADARGPIPKKVPHLP